MHLLPLAAAPQVRELRDPSPVVRQKSLLAARELLAAPVNHVQCVAAGATPAIVDLLQVGSRAGVRGRTLGWEVQGERCGCTSQLRAARGGVADARNRGPTAGGGGVWGWCGRGRGEAGCGAALGLGWELGKGAG